MSEVDQMTVESERLILKNPLITDLTEIDG